MLPILHSPLPPLPHESQNLSMPRTSFLWWVTHLHSTQALSEFFQIWSFVSEYICSYICLLSDPRCPSTGFHSGKTHTERGHVQRGSGQGGLDGGGGALPALHRAHAWYWLTSAHRYLSLWRIVCPHAKWVQVFWFVDCILITIVQFYVHVHACKQIMEELINVTISESQFNSAKLCVVCTTVNTISRLDI